VNGSKVYQVGYNFQDDLVLKMNINEKLRDYEDFIYEDDIKDIVTKEMFNQVKYEVN